MNSSGIQAAFFGTICRDSERRIAKNGAPFLQFSVRVGGDDPIFICVRSSRSGTVDRVANFAVGSAVYCEGSLFINKKTGVDGTPKVIFDLLARFVRLAELGRHATRDGAALDMLAAAEAER